MINDTFLQQLKLKLSDLDKYSGPNDKNEYERVCAQLELTLRDLRVSNDDVEEIKLLFQNHVQGLQNVYPLYVGKNEEAYANAILHSNNFDKEKLLKIMDKPLSNELNALHLSPSHTVLDIGCGPLPISALRYARESGCKVDCYDIVPKYVESARAFAQLFGLEDKISVHLKDGRKIKRPKQDVILVAMYSDPKSEIVDSMLASANETSRFVVRHAVGLMEIFAMPNLDEGRYKKLGDRVYRSEFTLESNSNFDGTSEEFSCFLKNTWQ